MPNTFKNALQSGVGTANAVVYQTPVGVQSTVIGLSIANRTTNVTIQISASVLDYTNSNNETYIVRDATVPIGGTIVVVGGDQKLVLEQNDSIQVVSSANTSADVICSILEIS
jgi:hypothetical protein